jgi:hypothetical protein
LTAWSQVLVDLHGLVLEFLGLVSISAFALRYLLHLGEELFAIKFDASRQRLTTIQHYSDRPPGDSIDLSRALIAELAKAGPYTHS